MSLSKKITIGLGMFMVLGALLLATQPGYAAECDKALDCLQKINEGNPFPSSAFTVANNAIKTFFAVLAITFLVMMLYGGWNWMTAMGDSEKVTKAKDTLVTAIIGIIIIIASYGITFFVIQRVYGTAAGGAAAGAGAGAGAGGASAGAGGTTTP